MVRSFRVETGARMLPDKKLSSSEADTLSSWTACLAPLGEEVEETPRPKECSMRIV